MKSLILCALIILFIAGCKTNEQQVATITPADSLYQEKYRPQIHFSPKEKWMNDPNGMVYHKGEYHLFYQYYPDSIVWGPMHWGHAVSKDLVKWEHLPVALYPDSLGLIFSGSAVVDGDNTSGLGTKDHQAMVAIYTYHSMEKEKAGRIDYQNQGLAYSNDDGRTWKKYEGNPIIKNPGIKDFRDPKVMWHEASKKWIMILAVSDHVEFYNSSDLIVWQKQGEFGKEYGAHGGVWECPDLFELTVEGSVEKKWVMLLSINPGGPNTGSATQYFVGNFDGKTFSSNAPKANIVWLDHGPDNYAGVTWNQAPDNRRIFLGWMNNWAYGQVIPTEKWRGAMTAPRDLKLKKIGNDYYVASMLSKEFEKAAILKKSDLNFKVHGIQDITKALEADISYSIMKGAFDAKDFVLEFSNDKNQKILLGYDVKENRFFINRTQSGNANFSNAYTLVNFAPRISEAKEINFTLVLDAASIEIFFDDGITNMTSVFYADKPFDQLKLVSKEEVEVKDFSVSTMSRIW